MGERIGVERGLDEEGHVVRARRGSEAAASRKREGGTSRHRAGGDTGLARGRGRKTGGGG